MLTDKDKYLVKDLLQDFLSEDLVSLATAVLQGNKKPKTPSEAVNAILLHATNVEFILDRRSVKKHYLYNYLHKRGVSINTSGSVDKPYLVRKVLEMWSTVGDNGFHVNQPSPAVNYNPNLSVCNSGQNTIIPATMGFNSYLAELAYRYTEWYYNLLNDVDPTKLNSEHFFNNCNSKITISKGTELETREANDGNNSAYIMNDVKLKYNLKFMPNISPNGLQFKDESYGHVMIQVNGTIHRNESSEVVGFFEQIFILLKDPMANDNWKIRCSEVKMALQGIPEIE